MGSSYILRKALWIGIGWGVLLGCDSVKRGTESAAATKTPSTTTPAPPMSPNPGSSEPTDGVDFLTSDVCAGVRLLGKFGTAFCGSDAVTGGGANRSAPLTQKQELEAGTCSDPNHKTRSTCESAAATNSWIPTRLENARDIIDVLHDDERAATPFANALQKYSHPGTGRSFPTHECGLSGNVESRVKECDTIWIGSLGAKAGGANWSLVSFLNGKQVWRNERTRALWSDELAESNHCRASGNIQNAGTDCSGNSESLCAETNSALNVPDKSIASTQVIYAEAKGEMGLHSATAVLWRLPTREDFMQAYADGATFVLPGFANSNHWTASVWSGDTSVGWIFYNTAGGNGGFYGADRMQSHAVRCIGR